MSSEIQENGELNEILPHIILTNKAAEVFKEACSQEDLRLEDSYMRIGAHSGGCSGYKYDLDWNSAEEVKPTDVQFVSQGVQIVVDKTCLVEILGSLEVDYTNKNLIEQGFVFKQLLQGHQCGCGESFVAVKDL